MIILMKILGSFITIYYWIILGLMGVAVFPNEKYWKEIEKGDGSSLFFGYCYIVFILCCLILTLMGIWWLL